jgi:peptide/nickel transport system permease protein
MSRIKLGFTGWIAVVILVLLVAMAVFAPLIAPHDPNQGDLLAVYSGPSPQHWLGTDGTGRDTFSRLVFGARTSLLGPTMIIALSLVVGVPLSLLSAWRGGGTSFGINRVFDVLFSIPGLLLGILAVATFGAGLRPAALALAVAYLPYVGRLTSSAAERERRLPYVQALSVQGHGAARINVRHILPNLTPLLAGQATVAFAYALLDLAALSFLGLAVQPPSADWGVLVNDHDAIYQGHPLGVVSAAVMIVATVLSLFVLGSKLSGEEN